MHTRNDSPAETVGEIGESELILRITDWLGPLNPPVPEGIGDDCAVFLAEGGSPQLVTVDPVIEGCHFDASVSPEAVGAKLLKRNISDVAAMGGRPRRAVLSLALPAATRLDWLRRFFDGLGEVARECHVKIVGGDVAAYEGPFSAFLTLMGEAAGTRVLTRKGGKVGDWLMVTGALGGSLGGHHHAFTPRVEEGVWLASRSEVRAMIDLSDGVAKDLPALLPPGVQAELDWEALPLSRELKRTARNREDGWRHALTDGEDYELLFVLDHSVRPQAFLREWAKRFACPLTLLGRIVAAPEGEPGAPAILPPESCPELVLGPAYEHFRRQPGKA